MSVPMAASPGDTTFQYGIGSNTTASTDNLMSPGSGASAAANGNGFSGLMLPWWVQQVGLTPSSAGGVVTNSGGSAGLSLWGQFSGGNGVAASTGNRGTAFGSGGGSTNNTNSSGAGGKGCWVCMWEF